MISSRRREFAPALAPSRPAQAPVRWLPARAGLAPLVLLALAGPAFANPAAANIGIYTCTSDKGRRLTSDRPIAECSHKEQLLLNRDGSVRSVIPPTYTAEERAEREARERRAAELRAAQIDSIRRDRNLMARFPDEAEHARAREQAMNPLRRAMEATDRRLKELAVERTPLVNEAEFYLGKPLPQKIRQQLDANDAAAEAQKGAAANQAAELQRLNRIYDAELERLRKLWGGAAPGSLGPMPAFAPVAPANPASTPRATRAAPAESR